MPQYDKYEDIPELTEEQAFFHNREDYTYIINAEKYQQTGELELKRVLKKDLNPHTSVSYVFFRREGCKSYPLSDKDLSLRSGDGSYVSPFQMNSNSCTRFLANMTQNTEIKEHMPDVTHGYKGTSGYLNFVSRYPDKEHLKTVIEEYAISPNGFSSVPSEKAEKIARQLNLTDENGNPDATRLPLYTIAALPTHVISTGNGSRIQSDLPKLSPLNLKTYSYEWINCKKNENGKAAFEELSNINYLTATNIAQYQTMNLAGADNLAQRYEQLVEQEEGKVRNHLRNKMMQDWGNAAMQISQLPAQPDLKETMPEIKPLQEITIYRKNKRDLGR